MDLKQTDMKKWPDKNVGLLTAGFGSAPGRSWSADRPRGHADHRVALWERPRPAAPRSLEGKKKMHRLAGRSRAGLPPERTRPSGEDSPQI